MENLFSGTGTTALAAKRLGRKYIGFELDKNYVEITKNKLEQEDTASKLGKAWVSFYLGEVVTLRNNDWEYLKDFYCIPNNPEDIDHIPIVLKSKINISTPFKNGYLNGSKSNLLSLFRVSTK